MVTADDEAGNRYAFHPGHGWFRIPTEGSMDRYQPEKFTKFTPDDVHSGRADIIASLRYTENPTISPEAKPWHLWANYAADGGSNFIYIGYAPSSAGGLGFEMWPEHYNNYPKEEPVPLALNGLYQVQVGDKVVYLMNLVMKVAEGKYQNLFYGYGMENYNKLSEYRLGDGSIYLDMIYRLALIGGNSIIISPPEKDAVGNPLGFPWYPDTVYRQSEVDPLVAGLQEQGHLFSLFSEEDQKTMIDMLSRITITTPSGYTYPLSVSPITGLPPEISKFILLPGGGGR